MRIGTPGFIAGRLTEGREARGLTQTSLSELTGIKSQSISHYEQGRQSPSPEALALLCETLRLPERFFLRSAPAFACRGVFFRHPAAQVRLSARLARTAMERRFGWLRELVLYLGKYVELPAAGLPSCPVLLNSTGEDIEQAAADVRQALGAGTGPLDHLIPMLERQGCTVATLTMEQELEGSCSHCEGGFPAIALRRDETRLSWVRYHAAREVGHLAMHGQMRELAWQDAETHRVLELQADRFARALLLPAAAFAREVWAPTIDALLTLKRDWRCPVPVMVWRCGELGVFDADQVRRAHLNLVRRGWKVAEPRESSADAERPRLLARSVRLLLEEGLKDRHSIVLELGLNAGDIEELAGLERGYLETIPPEIPAALRLRRAGVF